MRQIIVLDNFDINNKVNFLEKKNIINWNRSVKNNYRSILTYIESNDKYFQKKYIDFISKIKRIYFLKKKLNQSYIIQNNFSLWEMSLFEEKSIYKTPQINDLIKILALKEIIKIEKIKIITIYSNNKKLKSDILSLIDNIEIKFNYIKSKSDKKNIFFRNNFLYFTFYLIKFYIKRFKIFTSECQLKENAILIFDYFTFFDKTKALNGKFSSSYWKNFLPIIKKNKMNLNFIHITLDEKNFYLNKKLNIIKNLNKSKNISHNILDTQIDFGIFLSVLNIFLKNYAKYIFFKIRYSNNYIFKNSILHKMFIDSFVGVWSIKNLYFFFMFKKLSINHLKDNKIMIYVNEFHGWEKSMIYCLRKNTKSTICGIQFNPIRNWDLRYKFQLTKKNRELYPDTIIGFHKSTIKQLNKVLSNYANLEITIANNLRPLLLDFKNQTKKNDKILIIGDHDDASTISLLKMINAFLVSNKFYTFEYKPHPVSKIGISKFKNLLNIKVFNDNTCFKSRYSAYIVSNKTSLGLELLNSNLKTGVMLDKESLNLSPVDKHYQFFIQNGSELKNFIENKNDYSSANKKIKTTSWINIIKVWKKKLSIIPL
jgi:surface carbohydrate biosynthesis protein (TIGR04326 family)